MTWHGTCARCGATVTGATDGGELDIPAGQQEVICLACLCLEEEKRDGDMATDSETRN